MNDAFQCIWMHLRLTSWIFFAAQYHPLPRYVSSPGGAPKKGVFCGGKKRTMPFLTVEMAIFCYICCNSVIKCDHMLSLDICNSLLNPAADLHMDLFCRPTKRGVHLARFSEIFLVSSIALISPPAPHACFGD